MQDDEDKPSLRPVDSPAQSENGADSGRIARWARRKREQQRGARADAAAAASDPPAAPPLGDPQSVVPPPLGDADMPDLEQLDENSDVSGFMSRGVSEPLRQAALRQLFGSAKFNIRDGLDDYDTDFTQFEALGDMVTADMRFEAEQHSQASGEQRDTVERQLPGQNDSEPVSGLVWPAHTPAGRARRAAIEASLALPTTPTSLVSYRSRGRLAVLGPLASVSAALDALKTQVDANAARTGAPPVLQVTAFIGIANGAVNSDGAGEGEAPAYKAMKAAHPGVRTIQATVQAVSGHLGAFELFAAPDGQRQKIAPSILTAHEPFDLVLDLYDPALIQLQVPPPGYFSAPDPSTLSAAAAQLPDLNGEFEKPRYFSYQTDLCAHGARGQPGCTRCLDVCPTGAIVSLGDRVEVNPYLCQGGGSCASVCPSGAMGYAYPRREDQLARVRTMLHLFIDETAQRPVLLLHDGDGGRDWLAEHVDRLPEHVLPLPVEEIGATGMDTWLSALAYGASAVVLLIHAGVPAKVLAALNEQRSFASALLEGLGFAAGAVVLIDTDQCQDCGEVFVAPGDPGAADALAVPATTDAPAALAGAGAVFVEPALHAPLEDKRETIRLALDHLHRHAPAPVDVLTLPAGSPFGDLEVDGDGCTLCMACASVCPAGAVLAGGGLPQLHFIEQNCLQCGLCRAACPETVITLKPRYLFDREARRQRRLLNEDQPFHCVACGRVFGATKTIERVTQKLSSHWMYKENPAQIRRLSMCDSCRVKDMFETGNGLLDPHNP